MNKINKEAVDRAKHHFVSLKTSGEKRRPARLKKATQIIGLIREYVADKKIKNALAIGSSFCVIEGKLKEELFQDAEFICTDLDQNALSYFDNPQLTKQVMSATDLKFDNESFDFIIAHQVIEHINDYQKVLKSLRRLCRPGGIIYINVPNPFCPMIAKLPDGKWPKPVLKAFIYHNSKKLRSDFMKNTEKYHTGFTKRTLIKYFPDFKIYDKRKTRLKQEFQGALFNFLIDIFPSSLLFLFVGTNIWVLEKNKTKT